MAEIYSKTQDLEDHCKHGRQSFTMPIYHELSELYIDFASHKSRTTDDAQIPIPKQSLQVHSVIDMKSSSP